MESCDILSRMGVHARSADIRLRRGWVIVALAAALAAAGCGRSAPDQTAPPAADGQEGDEAAAGEPVGDGGEPAASGEPNRAGVQVISENPVVATTPTSAPPPASSSSTATATAGTTHVVQAGDTLSVVAELYGVSVEAISEANGITDVNTLQPGQELVVPAPAAG